MTDSLTVIFIVITSVILWFIMTFFLDRKSKKCLSIEFQMQHVTRNHYERPRLKDHYSVYIHEIFGYKSLDEYFKLNQNNNDDLNLRFQQYMKYREHEEYIDIKEFEEYKKLLKQLKELRGY